MICWLAEVDGWLLLVPYMLHHQCCRWRVRKRSPNLKLLLHQKIDMKNDILQQIRLLLRDGSVISCCASIYLARYYIESCTRSPFQKPLRIIYYNLYVPQQPLSDACLKNTTKNGSTLAPKSTCSN